MEPSYTSCKKAFTVFVVSLQLLSSFQACDVVFSQFKLVKLSDINFTATFTNFVKHQNIRLSAKAYMCASILFPK